MKLNDAKSPNFMFIFNVIQRTQHQIFFQVLILTVFKKCLSYPHIQLLSNVLFLGAFSLTKYFYNKGFPRFKR